MATFGPYAGSAGSTNDDVGEDIWSSDLHPNRASGTDLSAHSGCLTIHSTDAMYAASGFANGGTAGKTDTSTTDCYLEADCIDDPSRSGGGQTWSMGICCDAQYPPDRSEVTESYQFLIFQWWGQAQIHKNGSSQATEGGWGDTGTDGSLGTIRLSHDGSGVVDLTLDGGDGAGGQELSWTDTGTVLTNKSWGLQTSSCAFDNIEAGDNGGAGGIVVPRRSNIKALLSR